MSSQRANRFDVDLARAKREAIRSRRSIVHTKRELEAHEKWLHHHNQRWQEDLRHCQRRITRQRVVRTRKQLAFSLTRFMAQSCWTLLRGPVRLLKCCGQGMLIGVSWLAERARVLGVRLAGVIMSSVTEIPARRPRKRAPTKTFHANHALKSGPRTPRQLRYRLRDLDPFSSKDHVRDLSVVADADMQSRYVRRYFVVDWTAQAAVVLIFGIATVTLVALGVVLVTKPVAPAEVVVAVLPQTETSVRLTAATPGELPSGHGGMRDPSARTTPGFTLIKSASISRPLLPSEKDVIASTMFLMTLLPSPEAPPRRSAEAPRARPLLNTKIRGTTLATKPLAMLPDVQATKSTPALPVPKAEKPQPRPKPRLTTESQVAEVSRHSQKPKPRLAIPKRQTSAFVPHSNW